MKILRVGDPHITVSNIEESKKLLDTILLIATDNKVNCIEFLGDLFDNHSVIRSEVLDFWDFYFKKLNDLKIFIST